MPGSCGEHTDSYLLFIWVPANLDDSSYMQLEALIRDTGWVIGPDKGTQQDPVLWLLFFSNWLVLSIQLDIFCSYRYLLTWPTLPIWNIPGPEALIREGVTGWVVGTGKGPKQHSGPLDFLFLELTGCEYPVGYLLWVPADRRHIVPLGRTHAPWPSL